ncbi:MAG: dihydroneopterin aldolase [Clostridia bacterium]|nr:dihydroneopterin aldolase [Clostridia bacterium]MDD4047993.1 dihydroneopterin aldolase [Clostridia bacterium]
MKESDKILLQGVRFYGYHGVSAEEKKLGQWFEIDVEMWGDFSKVVVSDNISDTINYSKVYDVIKELVEGTSVNLIEHLAGKIAGDLLEFVQIKKVLVRVKKPQAPLKGPVCYTGVEIVRSKDEQ